MLFSYLKLKELAQLPKCVTPDQMEKAITEIGFEVENIKPFLNVGGLKFGKILNIYANPQATKLNVCEIKFADQNRIIQTSANNLQVNDVVVAFVPGSHVDKTIFEAKELQGIISEGMLSTPSEFGIMPELCRPEVIAGIATYAEVEDLTLDPITYLELNDHMIEVDILSNRSDANAYYVMALELAAKFKTQVNWPQIKPGSYTSDLIVKGPEIVVLEAKNDFTISLKEQIFLNKHGIKAINNPTDLSNLTLLMTGQPTHAYDGAKVGTNFSVKPYTGNATVLGGKEVTLEANQVVYIDQQPACVASVIGFKAFETTTQTKALKLELGIFDSAKVRQAMKETKLTPLAAIQGAKTLTKGTTGLALAYLSNRLKHFSLPVNWKMPEIKTIAYNQATINQLAGKDLVNDGQFQAALKALAILGFEFKSNEVSVPSYRHDVVNIADLAEEIFRFYGYNNFKPEQPLIKTFKVAKIHHPQAFFIHKGYQETRLYTLISAKRNLFDPFGLKVNQLLKTYVSQERAVIRNSQAESLQEVASYNFKRGMKNWSLCSVGMIANFAKTLALISNQKSFMQIKQDIINWLPEVKFERLNAPHFHPGVSAKIMLNQRMIGWLGKIHPRYQKVDAFMAEILLDLVPHSKFNFEPYNDEPLKFKDVTIPLSQHQALAPNLANYDHAFSVSVIDEYQDQDKLKVTVRIVE